MDNCKRAIMNFLGSIQTFFHNLQFASFTRRPQRALPTEIVGLACDYCAVVAYFMNALILNPEVHAEGPLRSPHRRVAVPAAFNEFSRKALLVTLNWTSVDNPQLAALAGHAVSAITRVVNIGDFLPESVPLIVKSEMSGYRTMQYVLANQYDSPLMK
jgi:hypothetical protein